MQHTLNIKNDFFNRNLYRDFYVENRIFNNTVDYNKFKNLCDFFSKPFKHESTKPYTVDFVFSGDRKNSITLYSSSDSLIAKIYKKLVKNKLTQVELNQENFTKLHWYFFYDLILFSTIYQRFNLDSIFTGDEYYAMKTIIYYFIRTIYDEESNKVFRDVLNIISALAYTKDEAETEVDKLLGIIYKLIKTEINMWSSYVFTIIYSIDSKLNPNICSNFSDKIKNDIQNAIKIKTLSMHEILYYLCINSTNLNMLDKIDILYMIFPEKKVELDYYFRPEGILLNKEEAYSHIVTDFTKSNMYKLFGYKNIMIENVPVVNLVYYVFIMLKYMNNGIDFNLDYKWDVQNIQSLLRTKNYILGFNLNISDIESMYNCNEWYLKAKDLLMMYFPEYLSYIQMPTHSFHIEKNGDKFITSGTITQNTSESIPVINQQFITDFENFKISGKPAESFFGSTFFNTNI